MSVDYYLYSKSMNMKVRVGWMNIAGINTASCAHDTIGFISKAIGAFAQDVTLVTEDHPDLEWVETEDGEDVDPVETFEADINFTPVPAL